MKTAEQNSVEIPDALVEAIKSQERVNEAPHSFYKYPARFSPVFAREAIKAFTRRGDTVLDPFCGGGTSILTQTNVPPSLTRWQHLRDADLLL